MTNHREFTMPELRKYLDADNMDCNVSANRITDLLSETSSAIIAELLDHVYFPAMRILSKEKDLMKNLETFVATKDEIDELVNCITSTIVIIESISRAVRAVGINQYIFANSFLASFEEIGMSEKIRDIKSSVFLQMITSTAKAEEKICNG